MGSKIPPVKGTRDVLPLDIYKDSDEPWLRIGHYQLIESAARTTFPLYGYREARTPILEALATVDAQCQAGGHDRPGSGSSGPPIALPPSRCASITSGFNPRWRICVASASARWSA